MTEFNLLELIPDAPNIPDWVVLVVFGVVIILLFKILYGWIKEEVFDKE
jgi:hypothetical protein